MVGWKSSINPEIISEDRTTVYLSSSYIIWITRDKVKDRWVFRLRKYIILLRDSLISLQRFSVTETTSSFNIQWSILFHSGRSFQSVSSSTEEYEQERFLIVFYLVTLRRMGSGELKKVYVCFDDKKNIELSRCWMAWTRASYTFLTVILHPFWYSWYTVFVFMASVFIIRHKYVLWAPTF